MTITVTISGTISAEDRPLRPRTRRQHFWYRILRLVGWDVEGVIPHQARYVAVFAHHTSNWDFILAIIASRAVDLPFPHWVGKHTLFRWPLGPIMRRLGGIPVDRRKSGNFVTQVAAEFDRREHFILGIAPEGTRSKVSQWKSGFYAIALMAQVPIAMGYLDYGRKMAGMTAAFMPSGDMEEDARILRTVYDNVRGRNPEFQGDIVLRPRPEVDSKLSE